MERYALQKLLMLAVLLLFLAKVTSSPLLLRCVHEIAIANQACFLLPTAEGAAELSSNSSSHDHLRSLGQGHVLSHGGGDGDEGGDSEEDGHGHGHGHEGGHGRGYGHGHKGGHGRGHGHGHEGGHGPGHGHVGGHERGHGHGHEHEREHGHGHRRGHEHEHGHGHGHRLRRSHGRRHGHVHGGDHKMHLVEKACCRWVKEVDAVCVCAMLLRLPLFLTRPNHAFTLAVGDECEITYRCGDI